MDMNLINEVRKSASKYKELLESPCTEEKLARLHKRSLTELAIAIPIAYANFLKIMDGLDFNGMSLYASEQTKSSDTSQANIFGFVETNLLHRDVDVMNKYLVFGGDSMDIYIFDISKNEYQILDRVSLDSLKTFSSFDEMIEFSMRKHILK